MATSVHMEASLSDRIAPEARELVASLDDADVDPRAIFGRATQLRHELILTPRSAAKQRTMVCIDLAAALAQLRYEPASQGIPELLDHTIRALRTLNEDRVALLAEWYYSVALLLQEYPPGVEQNTMHARLSDEVTAQLKRVMELAYAQRDETRYWWALSLTSEVVMHAKQPRRVHTFADEGNIRTIVADYSTYLYTPGELLAAIDAA